MPKTPLAIFSSEIFIYKKKVIIYYDIFKNKNKDKGL